MGIPDGNFIKINRSLLAWEWFGDSNTVHVLLFLMLDVNWKSGKWQGVEIQPGSTVTSRAKIAAATNLSEKQVRLSLDRLEKGQVIERCGAGKGQLVTLVNWAKYQLNEERKGRDRADEKAGTGPEEGRQTGRERASIEEGKKLRREEGKNKRVPIGTPADAVAAEDAIIETVPEEDPPISPPPPKVDHRDPDVQAVIDHLLARLKSGNIAQSLDVDMVYRGGKPMDGNRFAASSLLKKLGKDWPDFKPLVSVKALIDFAVKDDFHRSHCTRVRYLFNHCGTISAQAREAKSNPKKQSDEQYREAAREEAIRRFAGR